MGSTYDNCLIKLLHLNFGFSLVWGEGVVTGYFKGQNNSINLVQLLFCSGMVHVDLLSVLTWATQGADKINPCRSW